MPDYRDPFFKLNDADEVKRIGKLAVLLYELEGKGEKRTTVMFHQPTKEGWSREMVCDPDRLQDVLAYGKKLFAPLQDVRETKKQKVGVLKLGSWTVTYLARTDAKRPAELLVVIDQKHRVARQVFPIRLHHLERAVSYAQEFANERGHQRPWYHIVKPAGLTPDGLVRLQVKKVAYTDREKAYNQAEKNWRDEGTVLFDRPMSRQYGGDGGYEFTTPIETALKYAPKLKTDISYYQQERERRTPRFVLGLWYDHVTPPVPGLNVKFDPNGKDPTSREAIPYRVTLNHAANPTGAGPKPIPVVVKIDRKNFPPKHTIHRVLPSIDPPGGVKNRAHSEAVIKLFSEVLRQYREERAQRVEHIRKQTQKHIDEGRDSVKRDSGPKR